MDVSPFAASPGPEVRRRTSARVLYLAGALILALAATAIALGLRVLTAPVPLREDLRDHGIFYAYGFVGATAVFAVFAWIAGGRLERLRERRDWYRQKAQHDDLTRFLTPSAFRQEVARAVASHDSRTVIAVLLLTVNGLADFERRYGSGMSKAVLLHVAAAVRSVAPPDAVISRWGGLEIAILLPNPGYDLDALPRHLCDRIAERPVFDSGTRFTCRASVGGYVGPSNLPSEKIILKAEEALAQAHRSGKSFEFAVA
ncbi:MAG TPA: GGDEF domain-containing protein [Thermoanaerobaculia bacterium]|nr:GGDEF domain-containing protein [Thermoanaerobaculia bacterium]